MLVGYNTDSKKTKRPGQSFPIARARCYHFLAISARSCRQPATKNKQHKKRSQKSFVDNNDNAVYCMAAVIHFGTSKIAFKSERIQCSQFTPPRGECQASFCNFSNLCEYVKILLTNEAQYDKICTKLNAC